MTMDKRMIIGLLLALLLATGLAHADQDPRALIESTVNKMTTLIDQNRQKLNQDPSYARDLVRKELVPLVDFKRITRMVMGDYFAQASRDQKYQFLDKFKNSLINTYASGVTLYQGQKIEVLPMRADDRKGNYARVRVQMTTNDGKVVPLYFTLYQENDQWKVINVYVNGLDLRDIYRRQFAQSMQHYGDIQKVIDHWSANNVQVNKETGAQPKPAPKGQ